ncbi:hypothetical protein BAY61_32180 (plasmid) [Prauserella marina]|nr:hypothetical protein BAY61_32180 [Prauserella marina]
MRVLAATGAAVLVAGGVIVGAYWLGAEQNEPAAPAPIGPSGSVQTIVSATGAATEADPGRVAGEWLAARHSLRATDPAADAWLHRVAELSTSRLHAELTDQFGGGGGGVAWADFQRQDCTRIVREVQAHVAQAAPSTDTSTWYLVSGTAITSCAHDPRNPPFPAEQPVTVTLKLTRQPGGNWLVDDITDAAG